MPRLSDEWTRGGFASFDDHLAPRLHVVVSTPTKDREQLAPARSSRVPENALIAVAAHDGDGVMGVTSHVTKHPVTPVTRADASSEYS